MADDETVGDARARREREDTARELAIAQAVRDEKTRAALDEHERRITTNEKTMRALTGSVTRIETALAEQAAVAKASFDQAAKTITVRQFYTGVGMLVLALVGLILGVHGGA